MERSPRRRAHTKVGPRRVGVLTMPLQKAPPAEGEMKLRYGFCRQSLRLISFATSLCTREAFAVRRLQTFPRRAGVLTKPCKRLRPAARRPLSWPKNPFAHFSSQKSIPPAASRTGFAPCKINAPPKATTNWPPPDRRIGYAFAKDSATPIGEMKLGIVCSVNPSVSLAAHNSPCTGEAFLRKAKQTR